MSNEQLQHLSKWAENWRNWHNVKQSTAYTNYTQTTTDPLNHAMFGRYLASIGTARRTSWMGGKTIKVYYRAPTKPCPTCSGRGFVQNI